MKYIKSADKIGNPLEFNFGRRPRFQTILGGFFTIIAYGVILFVAYSFISSVFDTRQVDVSTSVEFTESYPEINLAQSSIFPIIMMEKTATSFIQSQNLNKYITIIGTMVELTFPDNGTSSFT